MLRDARPNRERQRRWVGGSLFVLPPERSCEKHDATAARRNPEHVLATSPVDKYATSNVTNTLTSNANRGSALVAAGDAAVPCQEQARCLKDQSVGAGCK